MKKLILIPALALCLALCGCAETANTAPATQAPVSTAAPEEAVTDAAPAAARISPLPDNSMDNLSDAIVHISLDEGSVYADENGNLLMDVKIYSYDKYDMVDIAMLKVGDTLVTNYGEIQVASMEQGPGGSICINGGLESGGIDLATEDNGIFFEIGYNDSKSWYQLGEATLPLSAAFVGLDNADPQLGEVLLSADSFLNGEIAHFYFSPHNTSIRIEAGEVVELNRRYVP